MSFQCLSYEQLKSIARILNISNYQRTKREDLEQSVEMILRNIKGEDRRRKFEDFLPFQLQEEIWKRICKCENCDYHGFPCLNCAEYALDNELGNGWSR